MSKHTRGVIEFVVHLERLGVVGEPGRIFDVEDVVAEPLEADDVMKVLPDDAGDRARAHEAHYDDAFLFHDERGCEW